MLLATDKSDQFIAGLSFIRDLAQEEDDRNADVAIELDGLCLVIGNFAAKVPVFNVKLASLGFTADPHGNGWRYYLPVVSRD